MTNTDNNTVGDTSSYRSIFKATSLFGGVQVFQILVSIIKSKFVAILLGPAGVGIQGLFVSGTTFVQSLTAMGLSSSAVRDVAEAYGTHDNYRVGRTVTALRKLVWFTGLLGMLCVILFSPILSKYAFGNKDYTIPFIFLSVTLLIDQLSAGQKVVLQGTRRLKDLAKASALGSSVGLIVSIPLYYLIGVKGIVPTLILNSVTMLILTWYFSRKIKIEKVGVSNKEAIEVGSSMLKMGFAMSLTNILALGCSFVLRGYIRQIGGTEGVGLYAAGFAILSSYVGMVFNAMSTDYYPRLAAVNNNNEACREVVNKQGEIASLIMCPLVVICLVFTPFFITLLYSEKFLTANNYVMIAALGMFFKMGSWLIAYQFIAKGESKLFVINEFIANIYFFALNVLGYRLFGLTGLGISFTIGYFCYFLQVFIISKKRYSFDFSLSFFKLFSIQIVVVAICFLITRCIHITWIKYLLGCIIIAFSLVFSLFGLDKRIALIKLIKTKFKRNDK